MNKNAIMVIDTLCVIKEDVVKSLSQEHGIISVPNTDIDKYKIADYLMILPIHACMTGNTMKSYATFEGEIISRL